jgi:hypothetical protein
MMVLNFVERLLDFFSLHFKISKDFIKSSLKALFSILIVILLLPMVITIISIAAILYIGLCVTDCFKRRY